MKLGMDFPQEWKDLSEQSGTAISDILYGYAIEDLMVRLEKSSFCEYLWITSEAVLTEDSYRKNIKDRLSFYYMESGKKSYHEELEAGDTLGLPVVELLAKELSEQDSNNILWTYYIEEKEHAFSINMEGHYMEMRVPVVMSIETAPDNAQRPKWKDMELTYVGQKRCRYLSYSKESVLAEALFEMVRMLELVGDMEAYSIANDILKNNSISGRHILEEFKILGEKDSKVISMKRLEQMESYKTYAYMNRKWQQYEKRHGRTPEDWEQVLTRITAFLRPMWKALCENEIFFDDWMPELGRFLG